MEERRETKNGNNTWWHLHWPRDEDIWKAPKILSLQMSDRPAFVVGEEPVYVSFSVNVFVPSDSTPERLNYILGLLNSRLLWEWYRHHAKRRGIGLEINGHVLASTPIRRIDFTDPKDKARHAKMVALVDTMLNLNKRKQSGKLAPSEIDRIDRQINSTNREIDDLVYDLYGVSETERAGLSD